MMGNGEREQILVVDDNEVSRYAKARTLRQAGFSVLEAATGSEALERVGRDQPTVVLLDINLPDISGWEVCRRIKSDPSTAGIGVCQISATHVRDLDTVRSLESGADASLVEPIHPTVLVATVRALQRSQRIGDALRQELSIEQSARAAAEEANRIKDEFLATLSHELRSPLSVILAWVTLLRSESVDDPDVLARALTAIERNTRLQARMIEDLLDVSRIISGKLNLDLSAVNLADVVDTAVASLRPTAEAKDIALDLAIGRAPAPILGDAARLQQIVSNLLSNALKFTAAGGCVQVRLDSGTAGAEIEVSDSGRGIDAAFLPYVFDRFRQADSSSTRSEGGLGIGLSIVRHLVELHGGSATAHSEGLGRGSRFTIRLPASSDQAAPLPPELPRESGPELQLELRGARVLVLDDEADAREATAAVLEGRGAVVIQAAAIPEALALSDRLRIDLVVCDIAMPGADGYEFIAEVRKRARPLPVLALTAYAGTDERRRILRAGFDGYLAKPVKAADLAAAVGRLLRPQAAAAPQVAPGTRR
jgi:signal transduction histidine kinase